MLLEGVSMLAFFLHLSAIYSADTEFFPRLQDSVIKAYFLLSECSQCYGKGRPDKKISGKAFGNIQVWDPDRPEFKLQGE